MYGDIVVVNSVNFAVFFLVGGFVFFRSMIECISMFVGSLVSCFLSMHFE